MTYELDRLLAEKEELRRARDAANGSLALQAELTRELDELYARIGLLQCQHSPFVTIAA